MSTFRQRDEDLELAIDSSAPFWGILRTVVAPRSGSGWSGWSVPPYQSGGSTIINSVQFITAATTAPAITITLPTASTVVAVGEIGAGWTCMTSSAGFGEAQMAHEINARFERDRQK